MEFLKVNLAGEHKRRTQVSQSVDDGGACQDPRVQTVERENRFCRLRLTVSDLVRLIDSDAEPLGTEQGTLLVGDLVFTLVIASLLPATVACLLTLALGLQARLGAEGTKRCENDIKLLQRGSRLGATGAVVNADLPLLARRVAFNLRLPPGGQLGTYAAAYWLRRAKGAIISWGQPLKSSGRSSRASMRPMH